MNLFLFAIGCFMFFIPLNSQPVYSPVPGKPVPIEQSYKVIFSETSKLSILGRTNISQFQCKYTQPIEPEVLQVHVRGEADGLYFSNAYIRLQTIHFKCGPSQMNEDLQAFLKVKEYPTATIKLLKIKLTQEQMRQQQVQQAMSQMEITLAGITRTYEIGITVTRQGEEYLLSGGLDLNICDFNLEPPVVMMGLIRVKEDVKVNFNLKACIEKSVIH